MKNPNGRSPPHAAHAAAGHNYAMCRVRGRIKPANGVQSARNHEAGISRVTVPTEVGTGTVVGYLSLSAGHIEREFLPKSARRNRPENTC
jgi:hypothetical protein